MLVSGGRFWLGLGLRHPVGKGLDGGDDFLCVGITNNNVDLAASAFVSLWWNVALKSKPGTNLDGTVVNQKAI